MNKCSINGLDFLSMLKNGAKNLSLDVERINSLNVFPIPDGDTGSNMKTTIDGGVEEGISINDKDISKMSKGIARAMVLSARGNSGVILSQFFKGLSMGLDGKKEVSILELADAMLCATERAYSVVSNPTEGTMLTVMREAGEISKKYISNIKSIEEYFIRYLKEAAESLEKTPQLLPILKKAGVIDSGGAGFVLIIEGMLKAINGEAIEDMEGDKQKRKSPNISSFNRDSELTYGYCTEFILQLQTSKVDVDNFDLNIINDFLNSIGNSIVSFKDDDIVKVHVHTFDPGVVLTECRKYGEFVTLKIENMNVQHSENIEIKEEPKPLEHKKYAIVTITNGQGLEKMFKDIGVDVVIHGGQTMNTSTQDFLNSFERINADYILVYPNNKNIFMAARVAADSYEKAAVYVVPTCTIAEGYSAISMLNFDNRSITEIMEEQKEVIKNISTLEVTYSSRDAILENINIKKNDFICIYEGDLISCNTNRLEAIKQGLNKIKDFEDKQVLTIFYGKDVSLNEVDELTAYIQNLNSFIEIYAIEGNQDIYSYIIGIE